MIPWYVAMDICNLPLAQSAQQYSINSRLANKAPPAMAVF